MRYGISKTLQQLVSSCFFSVFFQVVADVITVRPTNAQCTKLLP